MRGPLWLVKLLIRSRLARLIPAVHRLVDGGADFLHYCSDRVLTLPHQELLDAAPFLEKRGADVIDLSVAAPQFDLLASGTTKLPADQRGYPPPLGLPELREAVASKLRGDNGLSLAPAEEVLITHGATAALTVALDTFLNPGDRVVLFDPTYLLYPLAVRNRRGRILWVPTAGDRGQIRFSLAVLVRALRQAKLLILNSPANPTGGVFTPEDLEQIAWWCDRHDVLIFSDEVYERYQYDGPLISIGALPKARFRTLTAGSLSKSHALAAYRVGWLAAHRHLARACAATLAVQQPFVSTLCQQLALAALRLPAESFAPIRAEFAARRQYVLERLRAMGLKPAWPAGAFFVWVPVGSFRVSGRTFAERLLREKRVLVLPGELFGPSGHDHIRISYAAEDGRLREGLNRLAEFLRDIAPVALPAALGRAA
jgi:aspartate/methionine/tyrosine aminotransferase